MPREADEGGREVFATSRQYLVGEFQRTQPTSGGTECQSGLEGLSVYPEEGHHPTPIVEQAAAY